jgi:hypothetical protein
MNILPLNFVGLTHNDQVTFDMNMGSTRHTDACMANI